MTVDGLGFEEIGQLGSQPSAIWTTGSIVTQSIISGNQIFSTGSLLAARVSNVNGVINSPSLGSPGVFGAIIQGGSFETTAGSLASIGFRTAYSAAGNYTFAAFPRSGGLATITLAAAGSIFNVMTSGTANSGRNTSGVNVVGAASTIYDYIVIGF